MALHNNKFDESFYKNVEQKAKEIEKILEDSIQEFSNLYAGLSADEKKAFDFRHYPTKLKKLNKINELIYSKVLSKITDQQKDSWQRGTSKFTGSLTELSKSTKIGVKQLQKAKSINLEALKKFQERKRNGMSLSDRVWNITKSFQQDMEIALDLSLSGGQSAQEIARKIRPLLKNPEARGRKFRAKNGNGATDRREKRNGRGVYASATKNAMRLARTENNIAYHQANNEKYAEFDFVVGIEIRLSNNPNHCPMCEGLAGKYPKTFKFTGWHPQCRCTSIPILKTVEEFDADNERIMNDEQPLTRSENTVNSFPDSFKEYVKTNKDKLESTKSKPYFYSDNAKLIKDKVFSRQKPIKTPQQIADIQARWDKRNEEQERIRQMYSVETEKMRKYTFDFGDDMADELGVLMDRNRLNDINTILSGEDHKQKMKWIDDTNKLLKEKGITNSEEFISELGSKRSANIASYVEQYHKSLIDSGYGDEKILTSLKLKLADVKASGNIGWELESQLFKKKCDVAFFDYTYKSFGSKLEELLSGTETWKGKEFTNLVSSFKNTYGNISFEAKNIKDVILAENEFDALKQYVDKQNAFIEKRAMLKASRMGGAKETLGIEDFKLLKSDAFDKLVNEFETTGGREVYDKKFRSKTEALWETMTKEERVMLTKYTQTFSYLNEPLRNIPYFGDAQKKLEFEKDMPLLTKALNKHKLDRDIVVRRGTKDYGIPELNKKLSDIKEGDEFVDGAFMSTAIEKDSGFRNMDYNLIIVYPKGSTGIYAEPFSRYTGNNFDYKGKIWDGKEYSTLGSEMEWVGQRGSKFKVVRKSGSNIYLQVIGQLYKQP